MTRLPRTLFALLAVALAAWGTPDPARPIRDLAAALQALPPPLSLAAAEPPIAAAFDLPAVVLTVLADHKATPDRLARFQRVIARRIARDMLRESDAGAPHWNFGETRALPDGGWLVATTGEAAPGETPRTLQFLVRDDGSRLAIADMLEDGASYVAYLRRHIGRALATRPLDDVLAELESRYGLTGD